jgi:hypothetical protein
MHHPPVTEADLETVRAINRSLVDEILASIARARRNRLLTKTRTGEVFVNGLGGICHRAGDPRNVLMAREQ